MFLSSSKAPAVRLLPVSGTIPARTRQPARAMFFRTESALDKEFHPIANAFPMLEPKELQLLAEDIASNGLKQPIVLYEDKILDGRNRYRACGVCGSIPRFEEWDGKGSPVAYVVSMNLRRRHLDESQRAVVGARLANMPAHRPSGISPPIGGLLCESQRAVIAANLISQSDAAHLMNVSERSIQRASALPVAVQDAVLRGEVTVSKAEKELRKETKRAKDDAKAKEVLAEAPQYASHPSYKAICDLADKAKVPFFACRYSSDFQKWRAVPINKLAMKFIKSASEFTERGWVNLLYDVRGRPMPKDLFDESI